jgi:hypothetical protein
MGQNEVRTLAALKACRAVMDVLIAAHRGRIFNIAGRGCWRSRRAHRMGSP